MSFRIRPKDDQNIVPKSMVHTSPTAVDMSKTHAAASKIFAKDASVAKVKGNVTSFKFDSNKQAKRAQPFEKIFSSIIAFAKKTYHKTLKTTSEKIKNMGNTTPEGLQTLSDKMGIISRSLKFDKENLTPQKDKLSRLKVKRESLKEEGIHLKETIVATSSEYTKHVMYQKRNELAQELKEVRKAIKNVKKAQEP